MSNLLDFSRRFPALRREIIICVALSFVAAGAEIAVVMSLVPIMASLGVEAGSTLSGYVESAPRWAWLIVFGLATGTRSVARWSSNVREERATQDLVVALQSRLYGALTETHWDTVRRLAPPTITSALQTQSYEAGYGFGSLIRLIAAALLVIGYLISVSYVFPLALPVLVVALALMWWLNRTNAARVQAYSEDYVDAQTDLHQRYEDWVAISRISSLGLNANLLADRFESGARDAAGNAVGLSRTAAATQVSYDLVVVAGVLIGVPIAWWLETPPALLVFGLLAFMRVMPRAAAVQMSYYALINATAPLRSIERLTTELEKDKAATSDAGKTFRWHTIRLSGLGVEDTVREGGRRWLIQDVHLPLSHGEWLGLTGPTGAGKTTVAEVMLMLVRPDVRGDPDRWLGWSTRNLRETGVPRHPTCRRTLCCSMLRFGTILSSTCRTRPTRNSELRCARRPPTSSWERLPEGLDTRAGPGGRWLSGGERQRIGIARALLREPGFLVLDEPTAALDATTQTKLMEALAGLEHTMSVILITHRPELLRLVDRVYEIEDGRIREMAID